MVTATRINEIRYAFDRIDGDTSWRDVDTFEAYKAWARNTGQIDHSDFVDAYQGVWMTEQEYAEEYIESTGMLAGVDDLISTYFDYEMFTQDMFLGDCYSLPNPNGGLFVYLNV